MRKPLSPRDSRCSVWNNRNAIFLPTFTLCVPVARRFETLAEKKMGNQINRQNENQDRQRMPQQGQPQQNENQDTQNQQGGTKKARTAKKSDIAGQQGQGQRRPDQNAGTRH